MTTAGAVRALDRIATEADRAKVCLPGTNRAAPPGHTMAMARRAAARVGVTRVADITRLDSIGIPTYQAIRPLSRTLAVSQGKGVTPDLAKLSAMMESIEIWHVEQPMTPAVVAPARDVVLGYDVAELPRCTPSLFHDGLPLDWVPAVALADGTPTLVPTATVRLSLEQPDGWRPPAFLSSTNGLASGNTMVEAALHALYEIIERDAVTAVVAGAPGDRVDPHTLADPVVDGLCERIDRAGVAFEVRHVPSRTGLPCFLAWVSCHDYPAAMYGFGCHLSPAVAVSRAITEAVQTRLGYIAGARDDLHADIDDGGTRRRREPSGACAPIEVLLAEQDTLIDELGLVVDLATAAFGATPLMADLTRDDVGVPVVKVVAPGSRVSTEVL
ncbi:YcaO-like family protein [Actinoplanes sp. NPDC020271]|uniref:YcaO-like family protein n=1 Tax=Actinoplanes sp. NPDC020271 TaxID=3363896 RepID=UPI0037898A99